MWFILGIGAIVMAVVNIYCCVRGKDPAIFRYASISLTALTVCSFYSMAEKWISVEDWPALLDVVPTMSRAVWILTFFSIVINGVSFVWKFKKR